MLIRELLWMRVPGVIFVYKYEIFVILRYIKVSEFENFIGIQNQFKAHM
jgi:hypothetical protein